MILSILLHMYQPPTQFEDILDIVINESYRKIFAGLKKYPQGKITLNINAALTLLLKKYKYDDIINDIKLLLERGQIELTESSAYHAFLPALSESEIERQIKLNHAINKKILGSLYNPEGFFSPELGMSNKILKTVDKLGYKWIIADELSFPPQKGNIQYDRLYKFDNTNLLIFFRNRDISFKTLSAQLEDGNVFLTEIKDILNKKEYLPLAMDAETFGHHRVGLELLLYDILKSKKLKTETYGALHNYFQKIESSKCMQSTWALLPIEAIRNEPYERWVNNKNEVNIKQWKLTHFAIDLINNSKYKVDDPLINDTQKILSSNEKQWLKARYILDKALHSDQYWWASARPWWNINMIQRGAEDLKKSVLKLPSLDIKIKEKTENLYKDILLTALKWQREGIVDHIVQNYDEEAVEIIETKSLDVDPQEYEKVIKHLQKQMRESAKALNFKRAIDFQERIKNLRLKQKHIIHFKGDII